MNTQHHEQEATHMIPSIAVPPAINLRPVHPSAWSTGTTKTRHGSAPERFALGLLIAVILGLAGWLGLVLQHAVANN
jgi:hypothetical protein